MPQKSASADRKVSIPQASLLPYFLSLQRGFICSWWIDGPLSLFTLWQKQVRVTHSVTPTKGPLYNHSSTKRVCGCRMVWEVALPP